VQVRLFTRLKFPLRYVLLGLICGGLFIGLAEQSWPVYSASRNSGPDQNTFLPLVLYSVASIQGRVLDAQGPVLGATVRIQATENATLSEMDGQFSLSGLAARKAVTVSAWKDGYYCAKVEGVIPGEQNLAITLHTYQTNDNPFYTWIPPQGDNSCFSCKPGVTQVWLENDAHRQSATNPRFLTMYNGTDIAGNQSPLTRYTCSIDYGCIPLPPDPTQPYYGPGYKIDFPNTAGNCAACHTPGAAVNSPYGTDPNTVTGADEFGVHCDFCHKIAAVNLDPATELPYGNMPGVISMDIRRPFPQDPERFQLFFGTFDDDNVPEEDTYLSLLEESRYCAPCHFGQFWGVTIYNSYGEWLESPYNDTASEVGRTCQQCHMPAPTWLDGDVIINVAPDMGGIDRSPDRIHAHSFPGASSIELLQNAVTLAAAVQTTAKQVRVTVTVTNDQTGHHVPTDSPLRHLILLVQARDAANYPLTQLSGPTVPEWGGVGDPEQGYYAGLPGKIYAKVLRELWTQVVPSGAYWNHTEVVSDNRLAAFESDASLYTFAAPAGGAGNVEIRLLFRRAWIQLSDWKDWSDSDILMETMTIPIPGK
jgi:hypothetical protein